MGKHLQLGSPKVYYSLEPLIEGPSEIRSTSIQRTTKMHHGPSTYVSSIDPWDKDNFPTRDSRRDPNVSFVWGSTFLNTNALCASYSVLCIILCSVVMFCRSFRSSWCIQWLDRCMWTGKCMKMMTYRTYFFHHKMFMSVHTYYYEQSFHSLLN